MKLSNIEKNIREIRFALLVNIKIIDPSVVRTFLSQYVARTPDLSCLEQE